MADINGARVFRWLAGFVLAAALAACGGGGGPEAEGISKSP